MRQRIRQILRETAFEDRPNINKAFWRWFGDSKIVDKEGNPAICYHGTQAPEDFTEFSVGKYVNSSAGDYVRIGSGADPTTFLGSHFSFEHSVASKFASGMYGERHGRKNLGRVIPVYLKITNPYKTSETEILDEMLRGLYGAHVIDMELESAEYLDLDLDPGDEDSDQSEDPYERYDSDEKFRIEINKSALGSEQEYDEDGTFSLAREMAEKFRNDLQLKGHDGIIYKNEYEGGISLIVFEPEQIKSIFNQGTWNPNDPDMMK